MKRGVLRATLVAGLAAVAVAGFATSGAEADDESERRAAEEEVRCGEEFEDGSSHDISATMDPPVGSEVTPGDTVNVRLTWDPADFSDAPLYRALVCVTMAGEQHPDLSLDLDGEANDGELTHQFAIPADAPHEAPVCVQGAIAGDGRGYYELNRTHPACLDVIAPPETMPRRAAPAPAPVPEPAAVPAPAPAPAPSEVAGLEAHAAPAAAPAPGPQPVSELPRTGSAQQLLLVLAGAMLACGGAASMVTAGRRQPG